MVENKVPYGGFELGGGLGMNGNTLVNNNYLKINQTVTMEGNVYEIAPDSPLKHVKDVKKQIENGSIFVMITQEGDFNSLFAPSDTHIISSNDSFEIIFNNISVTGLANKHSLILNVFTLKADDSITVSSTNFTLTPTT